VSNCVVQEVKVSSPDYKGVELDEAVFDFKQRIESMKCEYETINEDRGRDLSFIKIYNQGEKFLVNRVQGKVLSQQCHRWLENITFDLTVLGIGYFSIMSLQCFESSLWYQRLCSYNRMAL